MPEQQTIQLVSSITGMDQTFLHKIFKAHQECRECPSPAVVSLFFEELLSVLFPDFSKRTFATEAELSAYIGELKSQLELILCRNTQISANSKSDVANTFFAELPHIHTQLSQDVEAMYAGDPAAKSTHEVIRTYPGFYAIAAYRVAHALHTHGVQILPRMITEHAHSKTGIDIHPGAKIGEYFCIDHGTGAVIGETAVIGNHVKIYQGVTLGALSVHKEDAEKKRHPTIEDHVILYAGATILGGETVIGHNSVIGGNVWLTKSTAPFSKIYYQAQMYNQDTGAIDLVVYRTHL